MTQLFSARAHVGPSRTSQRQAQAGLLNCAVVGAITTVSLASISGAQTIASVITQEEFVVTASRTLQSLTEIPSRIEVVTPADLRETPGLFLTDTLKKNSSVDLIQYPGGLSGVGIRGFRPEFSGTNQHVLILIDGHDSGATTLGNLPNAAIQRIEVLKGPASSLYGASAMGGVVNIVTSHSSGPVTGTFAVGYGSFETIVGDASIGGSSGAFDFDLALNTTTQFDDFRMGDGQTRPNTSFANHSGSLRVGRKLSDAWRVEIRASGFFGLDVESPGAYTDGISGQG